MSSRMSPAAMNSNKFHHHHQLRLATAKELTEQQRQRALSRAERRRLRRSTPKYRDLHASRERIRVEAFNQAFKQVRQLLPAQNGCQEAPHHQPQQRQRKMSKIETLRAAIHYVRYLDFLLSKTV